MLLQGGDATADRVDAPQPGRLDAAFHVRVEERGDIAESGPRLNRAAWRPSRIAARLDLSDDEPLPVSGLFHRFDGTLSARFHAWNCEVVHSQAKPRPLVLHVELQMLKTPPRVLAFPVLAPSSDGHTPSF